MLRRRLVFPAVMTGAIALASGCGGGGASPFVAPAATPTPHAGPTSIPVSPTAAPQTVFLTGGGYTLAFTVPPVTSGNTATMSAVLQSTLPGGVNAPQAKGQSRTVPVKPLASTFGGLAYLIVSTTNTVQFSFAPSFQFTVPAGAIASGQNAYLLFWDPNSGPINGWTNLLGPGTVSGNAVTFPGVQSGVTFNGSAQYIFALAVTTQTVPTATPAPTPTPAPVATPTTAAVPAYCSQYRSNASAGAVPLNITDDSGLGAALMVYVQSGNYMDNTGAFNAVNPYPLPAACFSTTLGSGVSGKPLDIPQGAGGRIYFAYSAATPNPNPGATPPNPFGSGGASFNPDYADSPFPWDKIEYDIVPGGVVDTTQVDFLGLPIEMSLTSGVLPHQAAGSCPTSPSSVVGVSSCGFASVFTQMSAAPEYQNLVVAQTFNGKLLDLRVLAPKGAFAFTSFQWNLFDLPAYAPSSGACNAGNTSSNGYIQCVLASYQATPRLFTSNVPGVAASGDWYCASSDGTANFIFTDVGASAPASCPATANPSPKLAANPFKLPISTLSYGVPPSKDQGGATACQYNNLFSQPYGLAYVDNQQISAQVNTGTGNLFSATDAFALWKALVADLNYGTALQSGKHPVGEFATLHMSSFWLDPMYNTYSNIVHANFDRNLAYSLAYDDLFGWSTSQALQSGNAINVRINAVPSATSASGAPVPVSNPASCPTITPEIGTY